MSTVIRRRYNSISFLKNVDGSILNDKEDIGNYFVDYFSSIFTSSNPVIDDDHVELISPVISDLDNLML